MRFPLVVLAVLTALYFVLSEFSTQTCKSEVQWGIHLTDGSFGPTLVTRCEEKKAQ